MITITICIILVVLLFLAICLAVYYRKQAETAVVAENQVIKAFFDAKVAWNQGMDELESMYQDEALTQGELTDLILASLEAEYDLRVVAEREREAYREVGIEKQQLVLGLGQRLDELKRQFDAVAEEKNHFKTRTRTLDSELSAMQALFTDLNTAHDEVDELYGEAATELLETHAIIEEVATDVRNWMGGTTDPTA